jgi:two-component system, chemotaxis family, CheB/CheR fusion protein
MFSMAKPEVDRLVVVGSSAGGIDALGELVTNLPENLPAPIVIAQHLDPRRPSHLADILDRRTKLKVETVTSTSKLAPGVVYLVPADRDVSVVDGTVSVHGGPGAARSKPSVDRLFATAAENYGENLVAVVLTGAGSDGAEGARAVKLAGGTVVIQDPATARYPSMPQSLAPTTVDIVANLDVMGQVLVDLLTGADTMTADDEEDQFLARFLNQLRDQTGIDFSKYKRPTIMRRLQRRMAAVRVATMRDYVRYAARNPTEYDRLANAFLIKVTEFFRDPDLFELLRKDVVPKLVESAASNDRELRVWSAGCATGEEAYSLAIILAEALGDDVSTHAVRVFATDIDNEAINFARRGIYSRSAVTNVPPDLIERYFTPLGDDYEVRKQIRAITVFGQHDLAQRAPFPRIDLTMSRNVLIYFTPELQRRALQLFAFSLREGGYLVLGKAESVTPLPEFFVLEQPRLKVFRRHGARVLIPPSRGLAFGPELAQMLPTRPRPREVTRIDDRPIRDARQPQAERAEQVLLRLPIGAVVLARDYDVQFINSRARELLGIHGTALGQDFVHMVRDIPSPTLRDGIDRARAGEESRVTVDQPSMATGGENRTLRLSFLPHRTEGPVGDVLDAVVIVIEETTAGTTESRLLNERVRQSDDELVGIRRQLGALEETNRGLLRANEELAAANAELRSANEELLVGSEEVQAATEEVETLNEELQATNEELETLNEELQATVEELNTTNDDLEARTIELEEIMAPNAASLGDAPVGASDSAPTAAERKSSETS